MGSSDNRRGAASGNVRKSAMMLAEFDETLPTAMSFVDFVDEINRWSMA